MGQNDAHPLTEEQLDALVDELQDRLGDSTARKYGRRGVLAALGLATLGTGSASAQASGSVGTASNPVDVEGYDVTASNSFTDAAGVQHTGELADLSDVGASGQWQEVNSGSNIEPIDGETVGTGSEDVDVGTVTTGQLDNSINSNAIQTAFDGLVVPIGKGLGMADAIDPSSTTTPVADAKAVIDGLSNPSGTILLPPEPVDEASQLSWVDTLNINIVGVGGYASGPAVTRSSEIHFTDGTDKGFEVSDCTDCTFRDFKISGPKSGNSNAVFTLSNASSVNDTLRNSVFDRLTIQTWYGGFLDITSGGNPFQNSFGPSWLHLDNIDAGDEQGLIHWTQGGRANRFGQVAIYPDDAVTGKDSDFYYNPSNNEAVFDYLNIGGTIGAVVSQTWGAIIIHALNYEPAGQNSSHDVIQLGGNEEAWGHVFGATITNNPTIESFYKLSKAGKRCILTDPWDRTGNTTINGARLEVSSDIAINSAIPLFYGRAVDVDNTSGSTLSNPVHCMMDGVFKVSTGTGDDGGTNDTIYGP